ncbi:hypothetical protein QNK12_15120 [Neobacillus cucumis]|nr:hypothetical protein QNK12_15120 [Neobacillus cucumis]
MFIRKKKRVKVRVFYNGNEGYVAMATDGERAVWNCFGSTKKSAKEMALFNFWKFQEVEPPQN